MGRLSLLQGIFLTQESNWGLLHCRRILYQLSYQGKTIALTRGMFVGKVMSLHFNILSKLVITFLPTSKRLLLSWLSWGNAFYMFSTRVLGRLLLLHKWSRVGIKVRLLERAVWGNDECAFLTELSLRVLLSQIYHIIWFFALLPFWVQLFGYILQDFLCSLPPPLRSAVVESELFESCNSRL